MDNSIFLHGNWECNILSSNDATFQILGMCSCLSDLASVIQELINLDK